MKFKDWLRANDTPYWEMIDIAKVDVSDVELGRVDEFDEDEARRECEASLYDYFDDSDYFSDIYDDPSDDPDFDTPTVEDWEDDNPMPESDDYDSDEEFESAVEDWHSSRDEASSDYDDAVKQWKKDMRREREYAQERADEARFEQIDDCVEEKRRETESEQGDYFHRFEIDGNFYKVTMTRESYYRLGDITVDNVFDILFEGPRGVQLTGVAGTAATKIYSEMLKGIKKLTEVEDVKGFAFVPAHPSMKLMYERFYQQFMKPKYIRVDDSHYIRSDIVKMAKERSADAVKKGMIDRMSKAHQEQKRSLYMVTRMKAENRSFVRRRSELIGRFVPIFGRNSPIFIWDIQPSGRVLYTEDWKNAKDGYADTGEPPIRYIALPVTRMPKISSQDDINRFAESLKYDESDYPGITGIIDYYYVSKPDVSSFGDSVREMLNQYKANSVESTEGFSKLAAKYSDAKKRLDELTGVSQASPAAPSMAAPSPAAPSVAGPGNPYIKSNTFDT